MEKRAQQLEEALLQMDDLACVRVSKPNEFSYLGSTDMFDLNELQSRLSVLGNFTVKDVNRRKYATDCTLVEAA